MKEQVPSIEITAPASEVEFLLRENLSPSELGFLRLEAHPVTLDPLRPERQGEFEVARVLVEFLATSVTGGVVYDLCKKIVALAIKKFGANNVKQK